MATCWKHLGKAPAACEAGAKAEAGTEAQAGEAEEVGAPAVPPLIVTEAAAATPTATGPATSKLVLPAAYKALFTAFFFVYVGAEAGFGSWITTYVLQKGVTVNTDDAAFIAAYYWAALTAGRALAIIQAVYMTASNMMALQLTLCAIAVVLNNTIMGKNYDQACATAIMFGYSLSSIFPLVRVCIWHACLCAIFAKT